MAREQKTPTKAAAVFVEHNFGTENKLIDVCTKLFGLVNNKTQKAKDKLGTLKPNIFKQAEREVRVEKLKLKALRASTFKSVDNNVRNGMRRLAEAKVNIFRTAESRMKTETGNLNVARQTVRLLDPQLVLNRGFAIVTFNDKVVTDSKDVEEGVEIHARLKNGIIYSTVIKK